MKAFLGAFGDPGHAFPMIALGRALRARGHSVVIETAERWRTDCEAEGLGFVPAPEYPTFPTREQPMKPYEAVVKAVQETRPAVEEARPDVVVHDILTLAPALAGEQLGLPVATLVPHVDPRTARGAPPYSVGARLPRTALGRRAWAVLHPLTDRGLRQGRDELNETRRRVGLAPVERLHGGISPDLAMVATFPQLEYPRAPEPGTHVVGPLMWEPAFPEVELPEGDGPLVLVAPSTAQDPAQRLLGRSLEGLAQLEGVRVIATWNRRLPPFPVHDGPGVRVVEWLSYARTMPRCDAVICHGGHGTLVRALSSGCVPIAVPDGGDQGENAARIAWAGVGSRLPRRLATPKALAAVTESLLADREMAARVAGLAAWAASSDAGGRCAGLIEELAAG
ncbi:MAG: glycosyltransferase [Solirubrobacterales bacterium]